MSKPADLQPRWLVSLMCEWARHELAQQDGGRGYPKKAAFLIIHEARSVQTDPTGYSARDFRELADALEDLRKTQIERWAAMMMYYKPWCVVAFQREGYPFATQTYYNRLHAAHAQVSMFIGKRSETDLAPV